MSQICLVDKTIIGLLSIKIDKRHDSPMKFDRDLLDSKFSVCVSHRDNRAALWRASKHN